jgi:hypothetical protein
MHTQFQSVDAVVLSLVAGSLRLAAMFGSNTGAEQLTATLFTV